MNECLNGLGSNGCFIFAGDQGRSQDFGFGELISAEV